MEKENLTILQKIGISTFMKWNNLTESEAIKKVKESSVEEIDERIGSLVKAIIEGFKISSNKFLQSNLITSFIFTEYEEKVIYEIIKTGNYCFEDKKEFYSRIKHSMGLFGKEASKEKYIIDVSDMIITVLTSIHDRWVMDNQEKFYQRDKKYQHMPIELIGWEEAEIDYIFLKPVLEEMNLLDSIKEQDIIEAYNRQVEKFIYMYDITDEEKLKELISKGDKFYSALKGQNDILNGLKDLNILNIVVDEIRNKGIGKNKKFAKQLFNDDFHEEISE